MTSLVSIQVRNRTSTWLHRAFLFTVLVAPLALIWQLRVVRDAREEHLIFGSADLFAYFYPMMEFGASEVRAGRFPLWNPYQLSGIPALATLQAGYLYPPHLLYVVLPTHFAQATVSFFHIVLSGATMLMLGRSFGFTRVAAYAAAFAYALSAGLPAVLTPPALAAQAWLPLGITAIHQVFQGRRGYLPVVSFTVAMPILAGAQSAAYIFYAYAFFSVTMLAFSRPLGTGLRATALLAGAGISGLGLAAPQLLPTAELAGEAVRSMTALQATQVVPYYNLHRALADLFSALIIPPTQFQPVGLAATAIALAVASLFRPSAVTLFCATLIAWGLLGATAPPWFLDLQRHLPALGWFRLPERVFFLAQFGAAVLAGRGLDLLTTDPRCVVRWCAGLSGAAILVLSTWVRFPAPSAILSTAAASCIVGLLCTRGPRRRCIAVVIGGALVMLLVSDVVGFSRNALWLPYANGAWQRLYAISPLWKELASAGGDARYLVVPTVGEITPKAAMLHRHFSPVDYEPLASRAYAEFFHFATTGQTQNVQPASFFLGALDPRFDRDNNPRRQKFLQLLSVGQYAIHEFALLDPGVSDYASRLHQTRSNVVQGFRVLRDPDALPRAYAVHHAECMTSHADQLRFVASPQFNPHTSVVLEGGCAQLELGGGAPGEDVSLTRHEPDRVDLEARMEAPGLVVLTDSFSPGWQAYVNGVAAPILRANTVVRAVQVPAGNVTVEFRYRPRSFYLGLALAVASFVILAAILMRRWDDERSRVWGGTSS